MEVMPLALFPGLHTQLLSLAVRKPGRIYHVTVADFTYCS